MSSASELQAILIENRKEQERVKEAAAADVCLLVDSPYRILRVSFYIKMSQQLLIES